MYVVVVVNTTWDGHGTDGDVCETAREPQTAVEAHLASCCGRRPIRKKFLSRRVCFSLEEYVWRRGPTC